MIKGLMTRDWERGKQYDKYDLLISGNVVNLSWAELQPARSGRLEPKALDTIKAASLDGPVRLRVLGGTNSPGWVMADNDPFTYNEGQQDKNYECPRWWYDSYIEAWEELQLRLYNEVHEYVGEVCQTGGSTRYGEPFIRSPWTNQQAYNHMGFDYAVDKKALERFYGSMRLIWHDKPLVLSVFPWQYMENSRPGSSMDRTFAAIAAWQPDIIGSHDIREDPGPIRLAVYGRMVDTGIPLYMQTAEPARIGSWEATLELGLSLGVQNIELPHQFNTWDYEALADYAYRYQNA